MISEQNAVLVYMGVALGLQVVSRPVLDGNATARPDLQVIFQLVWQVDSILGNALAYSVIGIVLGPM